MRVVLAGDAAVTVPQDEREIIDAAAIQKPAMAERVAEIMRRHSMDTGAAGCLCECLLDARHAVQLRPQLAVCLLLLCHQLPCPFHQRHFPALATLATTYSTSVVMPGGFLADVGNHHPVDFADQI